MFSPTSHVFFLHYNFQVRPGSAVVKNAGANRNKCASGDQRCIYLFNFFFGLLHVPPTTIKNKGVKLA